jgi:hypothetical protein
LCVELGVTLTAARGLVLVCRTGCHTDSCTGPCVVPMCVELFVTLVTAQYLVFQDRVLRVTEGMANQELHYKFCLPHIVRAVKRMGVDGLCG